MLKIEKTDVVGWEAAARGMRNPMNSWAKGDTKWTTDNPTENDKFIEIDHQSEWELLVGPNDQKLMKNLAEAGTDHRKYMRMIAVYADITGPLYWWKEYDTYKVGTVANSCSTMHKIHEKEFTRDDFSHEHLVTYFDGESPYLIEEDDDWNTTSWWPSDILDTTIEMLNKCREKYLKTKDKKYWWQMIQLLPSSYNQKRTVMLNYEVLRNMYHARKNHKLDCWHTFCDWVKTLPYSELITGEYTEEKTNA